VNTSQNGVFCDTSFFFASLYPDDTNFEKAGELLASCRDKEVALHTTWDVISETITLLRYRASYRTAVEFLTTVKPTLAILTYDDSVRLAAEDVFVRLSRDKRLSFCDAITFVVITQILGNMPCLTFDRDFRALGLNVYPQ
jgi:predicted nucleic acid-binding protein